MTNCIGQATTCTSILPNSRAFNRITPKRLSPEAKFRLRFIDNYRTITHSVSETCRLFGIARSLFYKWYRRFDAYNLSSLENRSSRPRIVRTATYDTTFVTLIKAYRQDKDTATYSSRKLATIIRRDYPHESAFHRSAATIGRIITAYRLFFQEIRQRAADGRRRAIQTWKKRKPAGLHTSSHGAAPRSLVEFDMKHIPLNGKKYYAFCAIDTYTREALIHVATTATSRQAKMALQKVRCTFGGAIIILNDNGSENCGEAYDYLKEQGITQYFARPYTPKDKPYIEQLIGTSTNVNVLSQYRSDITSLEELDDYTTRWTNNYHYFRPHNSLAGLTPDEYCATLSITIERRRVSTR